MNKNELKILGLSYSQSQIGSYVIVLSNGIRKLPLIIKPSEAQRIALKLENITPPRPLTHDLFKSLTDTIGIDIQEVFIYSLLEGIFYTKIISSNGIEVFEIECGAGDAIALSVIYECPIYTTDEILNNAGIIMNSDGTIPDSEKLKEEDKTGTKRKSRVVSVDDLEKMMIQAIEIEDYEIAAELRDRIQNIKENTKDDRSD